jgi:hypothetical protein
MVFDAVDPRFDERLIAAMRQASTVDGLVLYTSALSRYSRNSVKLLRVLEYLLAHGASVLTSNYLIRPTDVWVRRGRFVKPDHDHPEAGLGQPRGLVGAHRKLAATVLAQRGTP